MTITDLEEIVGVESLQFDFRTIKDATDNFSMRNKLGQGGFGVVYKVQFCHHNTCIILPSFQHRVNVYMYYLLLPKNISEFKIVILILLLPLYLFL